MTARAKKDVETNEGPASEANPEPATWKAPRKPRVAKPVNDLASADAAFEKAKKARDRAKVGYDAALATLEQANERLTDAARVLIGFTKELDKVLGSVLPTEAVAEDVDDAEDGEWAAKDGE